MKVQVALVTSAGRARVPLALFKADDDFSPGWIRVHKLTAYRSGTQTWRQGHTIRASASSV